MFYRVILSHNQTKTIRDFPNGSSTVFVFDAPTDEDIKECKLYNSNYIIMQETGNRSNNRNAGVQKILNDFNPKDDDIIEFFDGDRFPVEYKPDITEKLIQKYNLSCMLYSCQYDVRQQRIFVPLEGAVLIDTGTLCNPFYSCGFAMKVSDIKDIQNFNNGMLFNNRFMSWGGEDQFLGLMCDYLNKRVAITCETMLNGRVGGDADQHEEYKQTLQTYIDLIKEFNFPFKVMAKPFEVLKL